MAAESTTTLGIGRALTEPSCRQFLNERHEQGPSPSPVPDPEQRMRSLLKADTVATTHRPVSPITSRRQLVGGSILAALSGAAFAVAVVLPDPSETFPTPASPDALLLRLCAAAAEVDRQSTVLLDAVNELPFSHPASKAAWAESHRLMETYHSALAEVVRITAHTPEGLRAKAGFLLAHLENDGEESEIARSLARDVLGRASA